MEILVYSRGAVEALPAHDVPHVIVSISSSPDDRARLRTGPHTLAVLRLSFADQDVASSEHPERQLFSPEQARSIWELVFEHRDRLERVVLHCDAGLSRSPGVAAALARVLLGDDEPFFRRYRPNMLVYRTMLEVFHSELGEQGPGG